jgi:glycosyltransferase involved in cell wall biosynthesis
MGEGNGKKEVLYVWPYLEWGGAQIYFRGLMKLARERYAVRALMPAGSAERLLGYMQQLDVPCEFFAAHWDLSQAPTLWRKLRRQWRKVYTEYAIARHLGWRRTKRAILHVDLGPWQSFWLLLYLSMLSEVLVTVHTPLPKLSKVRHLQWKLKFNLLCRMKRFHLLASNRDMIESLRPFISEKFISKVRLAYSGVDKAEIEQALALKLERESLCRKFNLPPDRFFVFGMGQFIERKGCWVLLEAARELLRERADLFFVWLGTEPLDEQTARHVEQFNVNDSFRLITAKEMEQGRLDLLALLRLADLFVLPSFNEGLPVALLEAMALGKACIASNVNAIPEAIRDRETGLLVPPGDSAALAAAIVELKDNADVRERIATAGQSFVLENFVEQRTAQITIDVYDECARRN